MEIIKDDELIYVNDKKNGINSCGYNVNSLLFNSGVSPIITINKKEKEKNTNISSLFNHLVVPNWALHYKPINAKMDSKIDDNSNFEIIDDNLYDKLMDLAIYKDPFFDNRKTRNKFNKTKNKLKEKKTSNNKQKIKHKRTRKSIKK